MKILKKCRPSNARLYQRLWRGYIALYKLIPPAVVPFSAGNLRGVKLDCQLWVYLVLAQGLIHHFCYFFVDIQIALVHLMIVDQGHHVNQCPRIEKSKWNGNTDPKDTSKVTQEQNNPKVCVMGYSIRSGSTSTASQKALQAGLIWSLLSLSSLSRGVVLRLGRSANNQSISCLRIAQTPRKITDRSLWG